MTHSGPHNHSASTPGSNSGATPETTTLQPALEGSSPPAGGLKQVQQAVAGLRKALISSGLDASGSGGSAAGAEALLAQIPALEAAAKQLEALRDQAAGHTGPPAAGELENPEQIAAQLLALQTEIVRSQQLIRHGTDFWLGWAGLLGLDAGYTAMGMVAPLTGGPESGTGRKVSLKG